eukprot:2494-Heterococcus_DN1.PRE.2
MLALLRPSGLSDLTCPSSYMTHSEAPCGQHCSRTLVVLHSMLCLCLELVSRIPRCWMCAHCNLTDSIPCPVAAAVYTHVLHIHAHYHCSPYDSHIYHGFNPSDGASDTPIADRQKMYTHERMSCGYGSMLRYQTCSALPTAVLEWSLAIDNCMPWLDPKKQDYGQCNSISERLDDSWWTSHIRSFASRQIATFEKEMGWAFWCWKLDKQAMESDPSANFWSFKKAVARGYIDTKYPRTVQPTLPVCALHTCITAVLLTALHTLSRNHVLTNYSACHYASCIVALHYYLITACMHPPAEDWATPQKPLPELPAPVEEPSIGSDVNEPEDNIEE